MKKQNLTDQAFWICDKCGKEHELRTCFCDECGTSRPFSDNNRVLKKIKSFIKENIIFSDLKTVDYIIIAVSFIFLLISIVIGHIIETAIVYTLLIFFFANLLLIIIEFIRLIVCKSIKPWQRIITLLATIAFNPIIIMIILSIVFAFVGRITFEHKLRKIDVNELTRTCIKIAKKPQKFHGEYNADYSNLPEYIQKVKPAYVVVDDEEIMVALTGGLSHYGWKLVHKASNVWDFYQYNEAKTRLLISNIVINADTGKVN